MSKSKQKPKTLNECQRALAKAKRNCRRAQQRLEAVCDFLEDQERQSRDVQEMIGLLTDGEREVMTLVVEGWPNKAIASRLDLSTRGVEKRRKQMMNKMQARSIADLTRKVTIAERQYPPECGKPHPNKMRRS